MEMGAVLCLWAQLVSIDLTFFRMTDVLFQPWQWAVGPFGPHLVLFEQASLWEVCQGIIIEIEGREVAASV